MEDERRKALIDGHDLYNRAYVTPMPNRRRWGTWEGHRDKLYNHKRGLTNAIQKADSLGCIVPPQDRQKLYWEFPQKPNPIKGAKL